MVSFRRRTAALVVALSALFLAWNLVPRFTEPLSGQTTTRTATPRKALDPDEQATVNLFERAKRAVAYISTRQRVVDPWTRNVLSVPQGTGSGFVWDQQGHVVTNFHVVSGASEARVRLSDGREFGAVLVGISAAHDLAVLRIDGARLNLESKLSSLTDASYTAAVVDEIPRLSEEATKRACAAEELVRPPAA